jgi:hypothetical protein
VIHDFSGKKNFLPPTQLIMGFGYMFKLEESSIARHLDDRKKRRFDETDDIATEGNLARIFAYVCCIETMFVQFLLQKVLWPQLQRNQQ